MASVASSSQHTAPELPPQDATALALELRDIHLPDAVSTWPFALPVWLALLCTILITLSGILLWYRSRRRNNPQYVAVKQLDAVYKSWQLSASNRHYLERSSIILKCLTVQLFGRRRVARLTGHAWVEWLNANFSISLPASVVAALSSACYSPSPDTDVEKLHRELVQWINSTRRLENA